ncbi:recombination protein RecT [Catenuloplanes japonicus]|uniref:recombination protein RecT n=1 Tax=Catenuloplanes japonicus TaxID=33876 RepID=UPI0007C436DC|nr:recombination protein RecT [Catenuloplanes japonicus]
MTNAAAAALATRRENGGVATSSISDRIRSMESQFQAAMPKGAEAVQLVRDALTAMRMTKNLARCEETSVLGSLMTCAQLGLRPGVLGHAWLLPFWDGKNKGYKAQLVIGYQGLIELAHRSGKIQSLIARTVYANDEFDVEYGLADTLKHKPNLFEDRGDPIAYYAVVKFVGGGHAFFVMSHRDMLKYRDKNATAKNKDGKVFGPWVDHFEGMAHKSVVRQLAKYMPKSTELAVALAADDGVRVDINPGTDPAEATDHPVFEGEVIDPVSGPPAADRPVSGPPAAPGPIQPQQKAALTRLWTKLGYAGDDNHAARMAIVAKELGGLSVESTDELTQADADQLIRALNRASEQQADA